MLINILEYIEGRILVIKYELDTTLLKKGIKVNEIKILLELQNICKKSLPSTMDSKSKKLYLVFTLTFISFMAFYSQTSN